MATDNKHLTGTIIFSMVEGIVWANWPGNRAPVKLGRSDAVAYMMADFLAQCELGESMSRRTGTDD